MVRAFKLIVFIVVAAMMNPLAPGTAAKNLSTATEWLCSSQERTASPTDSPVRLTQSGHISYVIKGNKLEEHELPTHEIEKRNEPQPDANVANPQTFQILENNQYGLIAVQTEAKNYPAPVGVSVTGVMVLIDKSTGRYIEVGLAPSAKANPFAADPPKPANVVVERGTCDAD